MDGKQARSGHSILEILCVLAMLQVLWSQVAPSFKLIFRDYRCRQDVYQLQKMLDRLRFKAVLLQEPQTLDLNSLAKHQWSWHGMLKGDYLVFETHTLRNRLNGYFSRPCSTQFGYRLWLNRFGHSRIENLISSSI